MSTFLKILDAHLLQTQKISFAKWAIIIKNNGADWGIISDSEISKIIKKELENFILLNESWLSSSLASIRVKYKTLKIFKDKLGCEKIYGFSMEGGEYLILVGANRLQEKELKVFKLFAQNLKYISEIFNLISENESLTEELKKKKEAQQLVEERMIQSTKLAAVGEMAAGVAHELNNPLTTVSGFSELILDTMPKDSPNYEDMTLILTEARRARAVVRRLLDFSRQNEILRVDSDINEHLSTVIALVHHLAEINNVKTSVVLWNDMPSIRLDTNQIQQVFLNLIHNAIQSMPKGGNLDIETQVNIKDENQWVTIIIKDNGKGIETKDMEKIFEPFFTTKKSGKGTGLGLSISYRIIADHGGYIDVNSEMNSGSTFSIWLPVDN